MDILSFVLGYNKGKAQGGAGSTTEIDIFPLQTVSGFTEDTNDLIGTYYKYVSPFEIKEGETYYVEWDGTTYTCEGVAVSFNGINATYLGNGSMLGFPHNNEPFTAVYFVDYGQTEFVTLADGEYDVRVYQIVSRPAGIEIEPLMVTENGTYTAPDGKAYSPVVVDVSSGGTGGMETISTYEEMEENLILANKGKIYLYLGETNDKYVYGDLYLVEEAI